MSKRGGNLNARIEWLKVTYPTARQREKRIRTLWKRIKDMKEDVEDLQRKEAMIRGGDSLIGIQNKMKRGRADIARFQGEVDMLFSLAAYAPDGGPRLCRREYGYEKQGPGGDRPST